MNTTRRLVSALLIILLGLDTGTALAQTTTTWGRLKSLYGGEDAGPVAGPRVTSDQAEFAWKTAVRLNRFGLTDRGEVSFGGTVDGKPVFLVKGRTAAGGISAQMISSSGGEIAGAVLDLRRGELINLRTGAVIWRATTGNTEREFSDFTESLGFQDFAKRVVGKACASAAGLVWGKCAAAAGPNIYSQIGCFVVFLALLAICDSIEHIRAPDPGCGSDMDTGNGTVGSNPCHGF